MQWRLANVVARVLILIVASIFVGCDDERSAKNADATKKIASRERPKSNVTQVEENWGAIFRSQDKIGHTHEKIEFIDSAENAYVRTTTVESMQLLRDGQVHQTQVESSFLETPEGRLLQYVTKVTQNGNVQRFEGKVSEAGTQLLIRSVTSTGSQTPHEEKIAWNPDFVGPHGKQKKITVPPLIPGESREIVALLPLVNRPVRIQLTAMATENTTLLDGGEYPLLKVIQTMKIAEQDQPLQDIAWISDEGDIVKMASPVQGFEIYRCPRETALQANTPGAFDLAIDSIIPITGDMPNRGEVDVAKYELEFDAGNPSLVFSNRANQTINAVSENVAVVTVRRVEQGSQAFSSTAEDQPTDAHLESSPLIQTRDQAVRELASTVPIDAKNRWESALALESVVHRAIEEKNFSKGFLSAADVAEQREGDCTEHAVLLMALLRVHEIPSRGAIGLVYVDHTPTPGFAYHMWVEAWIDDRWVPLDATRGTGGIDVGYIKVSESSFGGSGAFAAFLPVTQVIGHLKIRVVPPDERDAE